MFDLTENYFPLKTSGVGGGGCSVITQKIQGIKLKNGYI